MFTNDARADSIKMQQLGAKLYKYRQFMNDVTRRRFRATIVAVEKQ
jgi:hypothetical protein